jgi:hypothetical protein
VWWPEVKRGSGETFVQELKMHLESYPQLSEELFFPLRPENPPTTLYVRRTHIILINETRWRTAPLASRTYTLIHELSHHITRKLFPSKADRLGKILDGVNPFVEMFFIPKPARTLLWQFRVNPFRKIRIKRQTGTSMETDILSGKA